MLIEHTYNNTMKYISSVAKEVRKKIGQFFTSPSIAKYMSDLMEFSEESINILDAGAGSGVLTAALADKIMENNIIKNIHVDLYENNSDVLPVLNENLEYIANFLENNGKNFTYNVITENFILYNTGYWRGEIGATASLYDIIISNPPYKKIGKGDLESDAMCNIVYGQPNIYFLFMAMSAKLLRKNGQMIFINPRSFVSGAYFKKFRKWFLDNVKITNIHLFNSRGDVFNSEKILQETLILKAVNTDENIENIIITTSSDATFSEIEHFEVSKNIIIDRSNDNLYILIPTSQEDIDVINLVKNNWSYTMPELGFKLSTGKVVDFRALEFLSNQQKENMVPLFWACNFSNNRINHPIKVEKSPQFILNNEESQSLLMANRNYIFVKRFTAKEELKRIQCALYFADDFRNYERIGVENHINYIFKKDGDFSDEELYGLFVILNSSYIDKYYRILNGSTQVNASESNSISLPDIATIRYIGRVAIKEDDISLEFCDKIIKSLYIDRENINGEAGRITNNIRTIRIATTTA